MNWLRRLISRETQLDKELRFHLEQHTADLIARGHDPAEARRIARIELGGPEQVKEQCRDERRTRWLEDLWHDAIYALRTLRQRPGFTFVAVLTLALGIGASTAIFSAVNPILFEPLPYTDAGRIMTIWYAGAGGARSNQSFGTFRELEMRAHSWEAIAVMKPWQPTLTGAAEPERLEGQRVSAAYFRVFGVTPAAGRDFDPVDDRLNGPNVIIVSDALWKRRFAGDPAIVGHQVTLDDRLYLVAGILPRGFENVLAPRAEVWSLLQYDASLPSPMGREWGHHLRMIGRLRSGVGLDRARRELDQIARTPLPQFTRSPIATMKQGLIINPLQDDVTRAVKPALLAVIGAVILLLAIACVNVTNLLLARGAQRRGEFAMRIALGAGRGRLIRQLLTESLLLSLGGGGLGLLVAEMGVRALIALSPAELPRTAEIAINAPVFVFAFAISAAIGIAVGLIPAFDAARNDLYRASQRVTHHRAHHRTQGALVVAEVALSLVLSVSAGLLVRSLQRLFSVAPGFDSSHVLTMQVQIASFSRFRGDDVQHRFFDQALDTVRRVPGVVNAAFTSQLPLSGDSDTYGGHFENDNDPRDDHTAFRYAVTPDYFRTMGIPLRRGRLLEDRDTLPAAARPVLLNESFARRKFPNQDPIGQRLRFGGSDTRPWDVVVGVVGDVKQPSLAMVESNGFYVTTDQWLWADNPLWLVVKTRGDAAPFALAVRNAIWSVDKDQPVVRVSTMDHLVSASAAERRFAMILFEAFALVALVFAATGIYGVLSGSVSERMREIGVRSALGASRGEILALVLRQGMTLTALGIAIGLAGASAATQALVSMLFGISRLDAITYAGVVSLLAVVSIAACWMPAWRASRVDPAITLRTE
jgi:putative ABC transport system permease protein